MSRKARRPLPPPSEPAPPPPPAWPFALALAALAAAVYFRTFRYGFLWDDEVLVVGNPLIRSPSMVWDILTTAYWAGGAGGGYWRPLAILTHMVEFALWGLQPGPYHATNVALHAATASLFFLLLSRHVSRWAAFWGAALWCVHPVNASLVIPCYGRAGLLEASMVAGLLALNAARRRPAAGGLCAAFSALGFMAKESALVFPALAALYAWLFFSEDDRRGVRWVLGLLFALAAAYVAGRLLWMPFRAAHPLSEIADAAVLARLWTFGKTIAMYVALFAFPVWLRTERHFVVEPFRDTVAWAGWLGLAAALAAAWRARRTRPELAFGLGWLLIGLGPTSNLVPLPMTMAEHWLYIPGLGVFFAAAVALDRAGLAGPVWARAGLAVLVLMLGARTYARTLDWRDGLTLYSKDLRLSANSFLLHNNLGVELFRAKRYAEAEKEFLAAWTIEPRYGMAINNLGASRQRRGDLAGAEAAYREAVLRGGDALAYANLASILMGTGRGEEAKKLLADGRRAHPYDEQLSRLSRAAESPPRPTLP